MLASQTIPINQILDRPGQRSKRSICLWMQLLAIAIALYVCFPSHTFAQVTGSQRYTLYIDTDGDANSGTTGCSATVQDASGSQNLIGIDYQVNIDTTQDTTGAAVNAVTLAACTSNAWGSPTPIESGARKLASTTAAGKIIEHIEAAIPMAQLGVKPGQYLTLNVGASGDYLISPVSGQGDGSIGLAVPNPQAISATPVPLMSAALIAALAAAMVLAGWWGIKTGRIKGNAIVAICTIVLASSALITGAVSAANAWTKLSIHDSSIADWAGISALATDPEGDNVLNTPDLMALYGAISDGQLFIRIDANAGRKDSGGPVVSGNRDLSPFEKASDLPRFVSVPGLTAQVNADWKYQVRAVDSQGAPVAVEVVGASTPAGVAISGAAPEQMVSWAPSATGLHRITLLARDGSGKTQTQQFLLGVNDDGNLPPDPKTRATPLAPNVLTSFKDSTKFLYDDTDPIQKDVAAGTIDPIRAAVLRGRILDKNGNPLAGATIKIQGRPEYGYTRTRVDGWFDMAVNGGGWLTVHVEKTGYLSAQRKVNTPWRDWAFADDVVLIPFDNQYSQIDLTRTELQTYWGSENTDNRGARRTTIVFPAGTKAMAEMADGSTQNLEQLTVRVSEYTIGESGPQTMPGELPTTVGYTWAANFSADEALALGAKHVRFNQPVYTYTNNFIQAPVGTAVPAGWYDFERTAWIGSDNGRVVQILTIEAGQAVLRITEADRAATSTELAELGITPDELKALAQMYTAGTQLWRTPMTHFTPWDCNWPWGPPPDAPPPPDDEPPGDGPPPTLPPADNPPDPDNPGNEDSPPGPEEDVECGCDIYVKQRVVGQSIALRGTPFDLYYRSDKRLDVGQPVIAPTKIRTRIKSAVWKTNSALRYAHTDFSFAGRRIVRARSASEFASTPQFDESSWDGKDIYGRRVTSGVTTLRSSVKYGYSAVYYSRPADFARAFDGASSSSGVTFSRGGSGQDPIVEIQSNRAERVIKAPPENSFDVSQANIGAWSLRGLRLYDPDKQMLHEAGGQLQIASKMAIAVQPVSNTQLPFSSHVALLSDGGLLVSAGHQVLMQYDLRSTSSQPSVFAGQVEAGYSGDGGPAVNAKFNNIGVTAEAPDGSIYISDLGNRRLRNVSSEGVVKTVAGNGSSDTSLPLGKSVPAVDAAITVRSMAILPDMSVLLTTGLGELARLTPSGMLIRIDVPGSSKVVGSTSGQAWILATVNPSVNIYRYTQAGALDYVTTLPSYLEAVQGPASNLILKLNDEISTLGSDGKIHLVSKRDSSGGSFFSKLVGFQQDLGVVGVDDLRRFARLSAGLPHLGEGIYLVGNSDGVTYEQFDADGRPLSLFSALTGKALATYQYNSQGYLTSVTDGHGNVSTLNLDGSNRANSVIGTNGQETKLSYNDQGLLAKVTEPGGATHSMVYSSQGLLVEYHDPLGGIDRFTYDSAGKLVKNEAPDGSGWTLKRDIATNTITATTVEGRSKSVTQLAQGSLVDKTTIGFDGQRVVKKNNLSSGVSSTVLANGTSVRATSYPDNVFGAVAPVNSFSASNQDLVNITNKWRWGEWNGHSFSSWSSTETKNGASWITRFENKNYGPRLTFTSPAGDRVTTDLNETMQPVRIIEPTGADSYLEYNDRGLLQEINSYASDSATRSTKWQYHPNGSNGAGQVSQMTNALGQSTHYSYDAAGRVSRVQLPDGRSTAYYYDAIGNLTQLVTPSGTSHRFGYTAAQQLANYNAPDTSTTWTYNRDRQPTQIRRPGGQTVTFGYDAGARLSTISSDAGSNTIQYDAAGQIASQEASGTRLAYLRTNSALTGFEWSGGLNARYATSIDSHGKTTQVSLNAGAAAPFTMPLTYDAANRLKKMGPLSILYANDKSPVVGTYLGNYASNLFYNAFGELADLRYTGNAPSSPEDDATRVLLLQKIRSLSGELLSEIARRDTCRLRGWPILTSFYGGEVWEWVWTYDSPSLDGAKRSELIATYGVAQPRNPDYCLDVVRSRLIDIESQASTTSADYSWASDAKDKTIELRTTTASGAVAVSALGSNSPDAGVITDSSSYNNAAVTNLYTEVLQLLDDLQQANYRYAFPATFSYERDLLGRIAKQQERVLGAARTHSYVYDSAGRLTAHTEEGDAGTTTTAWVYDANGNRTHENSTAIATYDSEDRLQTWKGNTNQYNAAGDLKAKNNAAGATSYQYDSLGNLRSVGLPGGGSITYVIDPQNRRIGKQKNGVMQYGLIYQNQLNPIAQTGPDGSIRSVFFYGERSNAPSGMQKDGKTYRMITDHLGSVRLVIDTATGEVKQQLSYDVWGNVTEDTNPNFQPFGFAGGLYDPDTGLTRFGARDYDAETGRWTAKDPIQFKGGDTNLYGYVLQNPVNWIDPNGKFAILLPLIPIVVTGTDLLIGAGLGVVGYGLDKIYNREKDVPNQGPPNEWVDGNNRSRLYGPDGRPVLDIDKPHQGYPEPHVHEWPNGKREHPGRDFCPLPEGFYGN